MNSLGFDTPSENPQSLVSVFFAEQQTGSTEFIAWTRPRGISMVSILCVGGGAGGGGGRGNITFFSSRSGGGGGGSGGIGCYLFQACLLPDVLFVHVGLGGAGGAGGSSANGSNGSNGGISYVAFDMVSASTPQEIIAISSSGEASGGTGGGTTTGTGGAGAAAAATATNLISNVAVCSTLGLSHWMAGQAGGAGSNTTPGSVTAMTGLPLTGGGGGGGVNIGNTQVAGGGITASSTFPAVAGGAIASNGKDGLQFWYPGLQYSPYANGVFRSCGGSGAGGNSGTPGNIGGNGAFGCGGGGGGGATTTGGAGGAGGNGIVIITAW
jgi:hypothetical protein